MKKYLIGFVLLWLVFFNGLTSCKKTDPKESSIVGLWVSTKVDTLTQYIEPVKPDALISHELKNCTLAIHADGSLKMIQNGDTISGSWNPGKPDTLLLASKYHTTPFKVDFTENNHLVISNGIGWISVTVAIGGGTNEKHWIVTTSKHFTRR